jgi:tripartite-type tricarboxylate transporter receptor subunit TctC
MMFSIKLLRIFAVFVAATLLAVSSHAQQFPSKPIRLLVGFSAGGATDAVARLYGQKLSELLNVPVVVDNKPGSSQLLAIRALKAAAPDGYTLAILGGSGLTQGPAIRQDLGYDPLKDFSLIGFLSLAQGMITVHPDFPARTVAELIAYAKAHPNSVSYASAGIGSAGHFEAEYLMKVAGLKLIHIPYKSDSEAARAVMAGEVKMAFTTAQIALPLVNSGKARGLLVTTTKPLPYIPGVPTLSEANVAGLQGLDPYTFFGLVGPAGMQADHINQLNEAINKISEMPDVVNRMRSNLANEPAASSPGAFRTFVEKEYAKWREVGKNVKLTE